MMLGREAGFGLAAADAVTTHANINCKRVEQGLRMRNQSMTSGQ
jgi:hypothetical protein